MTKTAPFILIYLIRVAYAGAPTFSVNIRDGSFNSFEALDPKISWEGSASHESRDVDIDFGLEVSARPATSFGSLPKNVWGRLGGNIGGLDWSTRVDVSSWDSADVKVHMDYEPLEFEFDVMGKVGKDDNHVKKVGLSKSVDIVGGTATIKHLSDLSKGSRDVSIGYSAGKTAVEISAADSSPAKLRVSQEFGNDTVTPVLCSDGTIGLELKRRFEGGSSFTALVEPNDSSLKLKWSDGDWTAAALVDTSLDDGSVDVHMNKKIAVTCDWASNVLEKSKNLASCALRASNLTS